MIVLSIVLLHFILYYLNIDPLELSNKLNDKVTINITNKLNDKVIDKHISTNIDIEESINELKNLNQYIDNESGHFTNC